MNSMADEENGTVQVKSRYGSDLRRFTVRRDLDNYQSFLRLVLDAHHLPLRADVALFFHDPSSPSEVLPLRDGSSLSRALLTTTSPPLRIEVHLRSGLWERESSGEEEDSNSSGSESSLSESPPHSPDPPFPPPSSSPPPSSHPPPSPPLSSGNGKECIGGTTHHGDWSPPSLPPHPLISKFTETREEVALPTQLQSLSLHDNDSRSQLLNSAHEHQGEDRFPYVIEIYDFDPCLTTKDIIREMHKQYSQKEFRLKWVDDTHALGIFATNKQAWLSAKAPYQQFKTRLLREGTEQSKSTASRLAEELRPCGSAPRPKTTAVVARRLVASALGVRLSQEQREKERVQRKELQMARDQKRSGELKLLQ